MQLQHGESRECGNCHKLVLGPGSWGINPTMVCYCSDPRPLAPVQSHGCICPPGSEKTCQGLMCPRRAINGAGGLSSLRQ